MQQQTIKKYLNLSFLMLLVTTTYSQNVAVNDSVASFHSKLKVSGGFQWWNVYTQHQGSFDEQLHDMIYYDNFNSLIRRARLQLATEPAHQLDVRVQLSADQIGKDDRSAVYGGGSNQTMKVSVLELYARLKLFQNTPALYITFGLQRPIIGRETIVSAFSTSSFEKSVSQYYLRNHVTGRNNGRLVGANLGGVIRLSHRSLNLQYDLGLFSTPKFYFEDDFLTTRPLLSARVAISIGADLPIKYSTSLSSHAFDNKQGLTFGTSYSRQGQSDLFSSNTSWGFDFQWKHHMLNLDGEYKFLSRSGHIPATAVNTSGHTGFFRSSISFPIAIDQIIEPALMYTFFTGATEVRDVAIANRLNSDSGLHHLTELCLNFHISSKVKTSIFYIIDRGSIAHLENQYITNLHNTNALQNHIIRGDQFGFGIQGLF